MGKPRPVPYLGDGVNCDEGWMKSVRRTIKMMTGEPRAGDCFSLQAWALARYLRNALSMYIKCFEMCSEAGRLSGNR